MPLIPLILNVVFLLQRVRAPPPPQQYSKLSKPYASSASRYLTSLLPLPHLPPPSDPSTSEILRCFHDVSASILSLHADALPIDIALSKFFSYVVPRPVAVDVENRDFNPLYVLSILLRIRRSAIAALVAFVHRHQRKQKRSRKSHIRPCKQLP